jgi:GT2 family glycosyltransferase
MAVDDPIVMPGPDPRVGVVVLTHNRAAEVVRTLERLVALPERPAIVVIDNSSTDGTHDAVRRRFPTVTCIHLATNLGAAGRNIGVEACDRPYIVLCDDDTWWEPGSLAHAADLLDTHAKLAVITGKVIVRGERIDPTCLLMARSPLLSPPGLPGKALLGFLAGASIVRRSAFLSVGGFEPRLFLGGEEELLTLDLASAGWALAYVENLVIHHHPAPGRDTEGRRRLLARNSLWIAWLRYPPRSAIGRTLAAIRAGTRNRPARETLYEAVRGLAWVWAKRRCISPDLDRRLRHLERIKAGQRRS